MTDRLSILIFDNPRPVSHDLYKRFCENCDRINRLEAMKRSARQAILDKVIL